MALLAALIGSGLLHAAAFGALVSLHRPRGRGSTPDAATLLLPFESGAARAASALSGGAGSASPDQAVADEQPPAPSPADTHRTEAHGRAQPASERGVAPAPSAEAEPDALAGGDSEAPGADAASPRPSADEFLDGLMARSAAHGVGGPEPAAAGGEGCPDRIEGTWQARHYHAEHRRWGVFTIRLERHGDEIEGTIELRSWNGGPDDRRPPRCAPGRWHHTVRMPAAGALEGKRFRLDALSHERRSHCMDPGFGYNLDHFTGTLEGNVLDVVNNDGGFEVNTPYRFRRIACN